MTGGSFEERLQEALKADRPTNVPDPHQPSLVRVGLVFVCGALVSYAILRSPTRKENRR